jgi:hypothetical protein
VIHIPVCVVVLCGWLLDGVESELLLALVQTWILALDLDWDQAEQSDLAWLSLYNKKKLAN